MFLFIILHLIRLLEQFDCTSHPNHPIGLDNRLSPLYEHTMFTKVKIYIALHSEVMVMYIIVLGVLGAVI